MTRFFVPGTPAPQGSHKYVGHRNRRLANGDVKNLPVLQESSKNVGAWRRVVADVAGLYCKKVIDGPAEVEVDFILHRPKSLPKAVIHMVKKPDLDKLVRSTLDGLSGVAFTDDNRVTRITASKRYAEPGEQAGAYVHLREEFVP